MGGGEKKKPRSPKGQDGFTLGQPGVPAFPGLEELGLFSYLPGQPGDPTTQPVVFGGTDRIRGRQFTTNPLKQGAGPDVTLSKFKSLHVDNPFVTPLQLKSQYERERRAKNLDSSAFMPASPPARMLGSGSHHGMFSNYEYMKDTDKWDVHTGKRRAKTASPKTFLTSPGKKGTYGFVGTNIGGNPHGVCNEFRYAREKRGGARSETPNASRSSFGDVGHQLSGELANRPSFTYSSFTKKGSYGTVGVNIGAATAGFNGEYRYLSDGRYASQGDGRRRTSDGRRGFVPSGPPKMGGGIYGTIGRYPEAMPIGEKEPEDRKKKKAALNNKRIRGPVFRPAGANKSVRTPSIYSMRLNQPAFR